MSAVEQSPREGLMWSGATSARLRPWSHDPHCAHLILSGSFDRIVLPDPDVLRTWQDTALTWGYDAIRTSALPIQVSQAFTDAGFTTVQHLTLLSMVHGDNRQFDIPRDVTPRAVRRRSLLPGSSTLDAVLNIDASAFEWPWQLDQSALHDAYRATASARLFVSRRNRQIDGFVLVGVTERTGFVQRLAVHPSSRRNGTATRLIARALEWTYKKRCSTTVVNTETTNDAALGLYHSFGFHALGDELVVMERSLR